MAVRAFYRYVDITCFNRAQILSLPLTELSLTAHRNESNFAHSMNQPKLRSLNFSEMDRNSSGSALSLSSHRPGLQV